MNILFSNFMDTLKISQKNDDDVSLQNEQVLLQSLLPEMPIQQRIFSRSSSPVTICNNFSFENKDKDVNVELLFNNSTPPQIQRNSYVDSSIKLLGKKQDYVSSGNGKTENEDSFEYIALFDGHGSDACIEYIKNMNLNVAFEKQNPAYHLYNLLSDQSIVDISSGSTLVYARVFDTHIEYDYLGDSTIFVYLNDVLVSTNINNHHTTNNKAEIARIQDFGVIEVGYAPVVLNKNTMSLKQSYPYNFQKITSSQQTQHKNSTERTKRNVKRLSTTLVPTQCLGHCGVTGILSCPVIIPYDKNNDKIKIICVSDGVTDVLCLDEKVEDNDYNIIAKLSANDIIDFVEERWMKEWDYEYKGVTTKEKFTSFDDCSVIIYTNEIVA